MKSKVALKLLKQYYRNRDWVWLNKEIVYLLEDRQDRKLGIIDLSMAALKHWEDWEKLQSHINANFYKKLNQYNKLLVIVKNEALPNHQWERIFNYVKEFSQKNAEDIMIIDAGHNTNGTYPHISTNPFVVNPFLDLSVAVKNYVPIANRKTFYNSLSRNPKPFRLLFTLELLKRQLLDQGCVSFGVSNDYGDELYKNLIPQEYKHLFPIKADGIVKRNDYIRTYPAKALDSVVKVVLESTYDDAIIPGTKCTNYCGGFFSDRIFLTEKTFFAFESYQLPLFVTVKGHVQAVRDCGFDVFDDVIDHSYDLESDPAKRIVMIADELERLLTIQDDIRHLKGLDERLKFNNAHREKLVDNIGTNIKTKLTEWFNR